MPRFATCRVSCGLWAARNACAVREAGAWGHAAFCNLSRFLRPSAARNACGKGRWGVGGMPRFATCRVSCGLGPLATLAGWGAGAWGACRALQLAAFLAAFGPLATLAWVGWGAVHAALCGLPRFLRPLGRSQRLRLLCCGTGIWGAAPNPGKARREACALWALGPKAQSDPKRGSETMSATVREARMIEQPGRPLHPTLSPLHPYLTTRFLSLRISSVTPSGGSPNVALSVLLPPSHVSCIAISRASIRQPSSTTVTTSPTS